mgnify:CR=1 FL=1
MSNREAPPFGIKDKLGYMLGDVANDFSFIFASTFVMVFYSKVMGISTGMIGTMFLVARFIDAFTDIGMGRIADRAKTGKSGKFRPWILRMCGPVAIASFLMYQSGLQGIPYGAKVAYMFVTYILWGSVFYTSINIPYGSMASVISQNPKDRSSLSVFRSMGGMFAGNLISVVAPLVIYYKDAAGNQVVNSTNFTILAGIFSLCAILCYLLCYWLCTERVVLPDKKQAAEKQMSVLASLKEVVGSRALLGVILSALLLLLASLMSQGLNNYLYADYFKNTQALSLSAVLQLPVMLILAAVSTKLAVKFGKRECGVVGMLLSGILYVVIGILHVTQVWVFIGLVFVAMIGMTFFNMQCFALVTDVIDDKEVITGKRDDGTIYGIYSFSRKIGQALAGGMGGWALALIGYEELAVAQTEQVARGIYNISTFFPGVVYLLGAAVLFFIYPLSKKRVESNAAELKRRHNS